MVERKIFFVRLAAKLPGLEKNLASLLNDNSRCGESFLCTPAVVCSLLAAVFIAPLGSIAEPSLRAGTL